jgi:hypothetical protein
MDAAAHLVAQGLAVVTIQVSARQLALMFWVKLLESVQRHDGFLPDQVLRVGGQAGDCWKYCVDEVWPYQLAGRC